MSQRHPLTSNSALETTIDKILNNTEKDILSNIKTALDESQQKLEDSIPKLESEYDKIISDGKKEADKIEKQIIGSSDIGARNKQLMVLEEAVDKVFTNAKDKDVVQSALSQFPGAELSSDTIDCLGGIIVKSKDGAMTFDNTIDARIERLKPLIRKDIASKFGVGN